MEYALPISQTLGLLHRQVQSSLRLLESGDTIPFIARYRKEETGELDEVQLMKIRDLWVQLKELNKRRSAILSSIEKQDKLSPDLCEKISKANTLSELEDLYLPYRPKRKTRTTVAIEQGLEPLADLLQRQDTNDIDRIIAPFIVPEKNISNKEEALAGARDILAERISENIHVRETVRLFFQRNALLQSKKKRGVDQEEASKYSTWYDWSEMAHKAPSHRILAIFRGEKEGILSVKVRPVEDEPIIDRLKRLFVKGNNASSKQVEEAIVDGYNRLLVPSMETELRLSIKKIADQEAIRVFAENLRQLLMSAPLGQKRILAIDPGFRTGCKTVCLDEQGKLLYYTAIFPHSPVKEEKEAKEILEDLIDTYDIEAVAIGNGTAGRETEMVVKRCSFAKTIPIIMVNESGASIYSANESAREEFPDLDLTIRGAISIGRRLMDPLAELVKLEPKSIGVGQYQHDVNQTLMQDALSQVVESCVNQVGVELNTASKELLSYVSGVGKSLAQNIVNYRNKNGFFSSRKQLKEISHFGEKAFEQSAGFLRIQNAPDPLDQSAVHPEQYDVVKKMASSLNCSINDLIQDKELRLQIVIEQFITPTCGMPTLRDILKELEKPGRDPRQEFQTFSFAENITDIGDLKEGQILDGIVTNLTAFGAFVDIGVHQDGLVHISELANRFVKDPNAVVKLNQQVKVRVISVDLPRKRISLSMKNI